MATTKKMPAKPGDEQKPSVTTDLETFELKGPVMEMKQSAFMASYKKGEISCGKPLEKILERVNFLVRFNEKGAKTEFLNFSLDKTKPHDFYNEQGKVAESISYNASGEINLSVKNSYNEKGLLVEEKVSKPDGTEYWKTIREYNENGWWTALNQIYPDGKRNQYSSFKLDAKGHRIENKTVDADGKIKYWDQHKYDEHGNAIELTRLKPDGSIQEMFTYIYEYDSDGNLVNHYTKPKTDEEMYEITLEPDHHGNWYEKVEWYKRKPVHMYIREIKYFGEEESDNNPASAKLSNMEKEKSYAYPQLSFEQAKWLSEASGSDFSALRYYIIINNDMPSSYTYPSMDIEAIALFEELKDNMDAQCIHSNVMKYDDERRAERMVRYTLSFPDKGYILQAFQIQTRDYSEYDVPGFIKEHYGWNYDYNVNTSQLSLLRPCDASGKRNKEFEEELQEYIDKCTLEKVPEKPSIYMVEAGGGSFTLRSHPVNDDFEIKSLDTNYGYGFEKFHHELMARFKSETKGLILFHGEPGTGKTYYIRHLLRNMAVNNKVVIYMPPGMVDYLTEPSFLTFLSEEISNFSDDGYFCALLIEDAEPLLAARQGESRVQGVSNLLNMTDGLLNDMLDLQIICTFNVMLKELDKALLRPGRLLARKEFKRLSPLDANILAQQLGVKHHFTKPATLAEIYAMVKDKDTLIHDVGERQDEE